MRKFRSLRFAAVGERSSVTGNGQGPLGACGEEEAYSPAQVHGGEYDREEDGGGVSAEEADDNCAKY